MAHHEWWKRTCFRPLPRLGGTVVSPGRSASGLVPFHVPMMKITVLLAAGLSAPLFVGAQFALSFDPSVPVVESGSTLAKAWAGGLNFPQISDIDLDGDGDKDLFLFDRSGNKVVTLRSNAAQGQNDYTFTHDFDHVYPFEQLKEWVLLRDYNGDGKEDIFSYSLGGFACYKNTSIGNSLSFAEVDTLVRSDYYPTDANLYVTQVDIPGIEDIDGDGDLDVITFSIFGNYMEHHRNLSMELYGTADSLEFAVYNRCWGFFAENLNNNSVYLNSICNYNLPNPQLGELINNTTAALRSGQEEDPRLGEGERAHTGSTNLPIDLDGDGDKDLLVGDILARTLLALTNGADLDSAYMVAQDSVFPVYDESVQLDIFPAPFYEDVDFDGRRDLLVAPNSESLAQNKRGVWYYTNTGTDIAPIFDKQSEELFQGEMFDVGEGAYPVPFDIDGDGLMDLLVSNYGYFHPSGVYPPKIAALRNTGTATAPSFELINEDYMGLSTSGIGNSMYPAFGDLDGDGDQDMLVGELQGKLHYFRNDAVGTTAQFVLAEPTIQHVVNDTDTVDIDVGMFSTPQLFDVDGDGVLDLLVGERNGNVNYYRMLDPAPDQLWELVNDSIGAFTVAEYVTGYSVPFMYLNGTGQRELVVGTESGWIHKYDGIEGNLDGAWNLVDDHWQDVREGKFTAVALHDFNGDSYLDAVIGNYRGGISYWRNDFAAAMQDLEGVTSAEAFTIMPNPAAGPTVIELGIPVQGRLHLEVLNSVGQVVHSGTVRGRRIELDTRGFAPAVYMVRLGDGTLYWTQRLVVMR